MIALIITIIVLLILAGVSIAILTGEHGILTQTQNAKKVTDIAEVKEQAQLDIANWVAERLKNQEDTTLDDATVKSIIEETNKDKSDKYYSKITETSIITKQGNEVLLAELYSKDEGEKNNGILAYDKLKIDEESKQTPYVNYIDKDGQKILCRVLYDSASDYGLQLISDKPVEVLSLGGTNKSEAEQSYMKSLVTLNEVANKYRNDLLSPEKGARCVGNYPDRPEESYYLGLLYEGGRSWEHKGYLKDINQLKSLSISNCGEKYWLASHYASSRDNDAWQGSVFGCLCFYDDLSYEDLYATVPDYSSQWSPRVKKCGVRAVFTIKENVHLKEGGDGLTPQTAYEFDI